MSQNILFSALVMWFLFLPIPIINDFFREKFYKEKIGELHAHQLGSVLVSAVFLCYSYLFFHNQVAKLTTVWLLGIGALWLSLTLIFELGLGLIAKRSWSFMLADYNIFKGRIWPLVLLTILCSLSIIKMLF